MTGMMEAAAMVFESGAECCAECPHAVDGAVIDGHAFPGGWHCDVNDVAGTRGKDGEREALCRMPWLWELE